MPNTLSQFFVWAALSLFSGLIPGASATEPQQRGQELWENRPEVSEELRDEQESAYFDLMQQEKPACDELVELRTQLLYMGSKGIASAFFPNLVEHPTANCPELSGFDHLFAGATYFNLGQYTPAIHHFQQATQAIPETHKAHATCLFNSASALHAASRTTEALQTLDTLLQLTTHTISPHVIRTNMASMQIALNRLHTAKLTLDMIDRSKLNAYWNQLVDWNYYHMFLKNHEFEASDSIWSGTLRAIMPDDIPSTMQDEVLSSLLATQDLEYFARFREVVLADEASELKAADHPYHELFSPFETLADIAPIWQQFITWETQYRAFVRNRLKTAGALDEQLIASLEEQLAAQTADADKWRNSLMILLVVGMASALVWTGVRFRKQQTKIRAFEKLVSETQQYQTLESETPGKAMTPSIEEIRQIGEAISYGNRTSDAMLILRKWASNLERATGLGHELDLAQLPDFEILNTREREVTLLIARGFDAKEIARLTGMSNAYTYNVRSRVRAKLGIPPEADILEWLQDFSRPD